MRSREPHFPTCSRTEARELDRRAIEEFGIPSCILMENAGRACALELLGWPELASAEALVVCGLGNNGGDGLVIARTLVNHGHLARVIVVGNAQQHAHAGPDVQLNLRLWLGLGGRIDYLDGGRGLEHLSRALAGAGVLVDALFGTGLVRELAEPWAGVIRAMNGAQRPIFAVDMPSGIDADTGQILGAAIRATVTGTLAAFKHGQGLGAGPSHCGRLLPLEIGIPTAGRFRRPS